MKVVPKKDQVLGRRLHLVKSEGGIDLPDSDWKGVTVFVVIDAVGEDVVGYAPGEVVLPHALNFIHLRGHKPLVIFAQDKILAAIEDVDMSLFSAEGESG